MTNKKKQFRILLDQYHGMSLFSSRHVRELRKNGFDLLRVNSALDKNILSEADVLVIWFTRYHENIFAHFMPEELDLIREYIESGGAAFLIGLGWVWTSYEDTPAIDDYPLNLIAEPFGIFFSEAIIADVGGVSYEQEPITFHRPFFASHPITKNVEKIGASDSAPGSLIVEEPAIPVVWGNDETSDSDRFKNPVILAANENAGSGRIVCLQHASYIEKFEFDNFVLLQNILNWLAGNDENMDGVPGESKSISVPLEPDRLENDLEMKTVLELGRIIDKYFNEFEIKTLCMDLEIDPENLPHETKVQMAIELVAFMDRRMEADKLILLLRDRRPKVKEFSDDWFNRD
ncbi:MAG: hypothetical protein CL608_15800 [Anaerolineaceae bacterium]|nr:hypothetical protein [Anaerolineaceae bacterium]